MTHVYSLLTINLLEIRFDYILNHMSKWYVLNGLFLNIDKVYTMKLIETTSNMIHFNSSRQGDQRIDKISWSQN